MTSTSTPKMYQRFVFYINRVPIEIGAELTFRVTGREVIALTNLFLQTIRHDSTYNRQQLGDDFFLYLKSRTAGASHADAMLSMITLPGFCH